MSSSFVSPSAICAVGSDSKWILIFHLPYLDDPLGPAQSFRLSSPHVGFSSVTQLRMDPSGASTDDGVDEQLIAVGDSSRNRPRSPPWAIETCVRLFRLHERRAYAKIFHHGSVNALLSLPLVCWNDLPLLVSGDDGGTILISQSQNGFCWASLALQDKEAVTCFLSVPEWSGSTDHLFVGGGGGSLCLFDLHTKKNVRSFEGHAKSVSSLCCDVRRGVFISTSLDGSVKLWSSQSRGSIETFFAGPGTCSCFVEETGTLLVGMDDSGTTQIWDARFMKTHREVLFGGSSMRRVGQSSFVSVGLRGIFVWDISGRLLEAKKPPRPARDVELIRTGFLAGRRDLDRFDEAMDERLLYLLRFPLIVGVNLVKTSSSSLFVFRWARIHMTSA